MNACLSCVQVLPIEESLQNRKKFHSIFFSGFTLVAMLVLGFGLVGYLVRSSCDHLLALPMPLPTHPLSSAFCKLSPRHLSTQQAYGREVESMILQDLPFNWITSALATPTLPSLHSHPLWYQHPQRF